MKIINKVFFFHIVNILLLLIFNNVYDWEGRYFIIGLMTIIIPNFIGLIVNAVIYFLIKSNNAFLFFLITFVTNEVAFSLYYSRVILFGLYKPLLIPNEIPVNPIYFLFISLSSLLSALIVVVANKSGNVTNYHF